VQNPKKKRQLSVSRPPQFLRCGRESKLRKTVSSVAASLSAVNATRMTATSAQKAKIAPHKRLLSMQTKVDVLPHEKYKKLKC